jgi:HSP20 family protein
VDESLRIFLVDDNASSDSALDASPPPQQQITRQWITMHQANTWQPPTDVFELEDRLVVVVEIAGMRDGDFNVALQDRRLMISGTRQRVGREGIAYHQVEIRYGRFLSEVIAPWPVERETITAAYKDGFLRVELPRERNRTVHMVEVEPDDPTPTS